MAKEASKQHNSLVEKEEKIARDFLALFASGLIRLRIIESGIDFQIAKDTCRRGILTCMNDFKHCGKRWYAPLAEELEKVGKNETNLILTEHPAIFTSFNVKRFREGMKNEGEDYIINRIPNIDPRTKAELGKMYKDYL